MYRYSASHGSRRMNPAGKRERPGGEYARLFVVSARLRRNRIAAARLPDHGPLGSTPRIGRYRQGGRRRTSSVKRALTIVAVVLGIALIVIGIVYWVEPAKSLPGFFPGQESHSTTHHVKHGIAAFLVGLALLAFAWFYSAPKKSKPAA